MVSFDTMRIAPQSGDTPVFSVTALVTRRVEFLIPASSEHEAEELVEERLNEGETGIVHWQRLEIEDSHLVEHPHTDGTGFYT